MKCSHCSAPMELIREESGPRSVVRWHRCPTCGSAHMLAHPNLAAAAGPPSLVGYRDPQFRSRSPSHGSAYSGPEHRVARRGW